MEYGGDQLETWQVRKEQGGETLGPLTLEEMQELYSEGELDETSRVYEPSLDSWEPLWRVEGLIEKLAEKPSSSEATSRTENLPGQTPGGGSAGGRSGGHSGQSGVESPSSYTGGGYEDPQIQSVGAGGYPPEIAQLNWNWGAFFLPIFWGPSHGYWWTLALLILGIIPYVGGIAFLAAQIYLGAMGQKMAWDSGRFRSAEECIDCQRIWLWWGLALFILNLVFMTALYVALFVYIFGQGGFPNGFTP